MFFVYYVPILVCACSLIANYVSFHYVVFIDAAKEKADDPVAAEGGEEEEEVSDKKKKKKKKGKGEEKEKEKKGRMGKCELLSRVNWGVGFIFLSTHVYNVEILFLADGFYLFD